MTDRRVINEGQYAKVPAGDVVQKGAHLKIPAPPPPTESPSTSPQSSDDTGGKK
jgi:hypothetical protein